MMVYKTQNLWTYGLCLVNDISSFTPEGENISSLRNVVFSRYLELLTVDTDCV
jgi:hypothetical protein